jgi:putative heme-binding domain-containing protein
LCTLDGLQALRTGVISHALADEHPGIRRHAVRLAEPRLDSAPALGEVLISLVHDPDPLVQLQVAYSLGQWHDRRAGRALASMALTHHDDAYLSAAVISSINAENLEEIVAAVLATIDERTGMASDEQRFIEQLLRVAAALGDRITVNRLLGSQLAPGPLGLSNRQMSAMAGVLAIFGQHERKLESLLNQATRQQLNDIFAAARRTVADNSSLPSDRLSAIQLLGNNLTGQPADTDLLGRLLAPQNSPQLQSAAVEALASRATEQSAQQLLTGWKSHSPALRSQILDVLLSRPSWTELLLAAISRGDVLAGHIDPRRRQQLLQHNDAAIHQRAEQLLAGAIDASRQKVIEQYRDIASLAGDAAAGKTVFNKRCAACHLGDGVGYAVGPDIIALTDRSPTAMLVAVLDPNRAVEDRFLDYIAVTADGRQFTGMLSSETGSSITLTGQEGKQVVILRSQLEELHCSGKSLMPEGMEKDISRQELANLLAYLAGPMAKTNPAPSPRP